MSQKVQTVPITSDLNSVLSRVAIKDDSLNYKSNSWVKYTTSPDSQLDCENIRNAIKQLDLFSAAKFALDRPDSVIPFYFRNNYLKLDKIEYDTTLPSKVIVPYLPDILDYQELIDKASKIINYSTSLRTKHKISHVSQILVPTGVKLIKIRIIYNLTSDVDSDTPTKNHIMNISLDTFTGPIFHNKLFTTKIVNNRLSILKSDEVYQVFIRSINFVV